MDWGEVRRTDHTNQIEPDEETNRLANAVIGAAIEVHRILGPGFLESVYEKALRVELRLRKIPFVPQAPFSVISRGEAVGDVQLDLLVGNTLVIELKAVDTLSPIHKAQLISYLKATRITLGLLINFNTIILKDGIKRVVFSPT